MQASLASLDTHPTHAAGSLARWHTKHVLG